MIRKMMAGLLAVTAAAALAYGGLVWHNNREVPPPSPQEIAASRERSIAWLMENRQGILRNKNPALWWMIGQAADASGDDRLHALYAEFLRDFTANHGDSIWTTFFSSEAARNANIPYAEYENLKPYQQYFVFSLTCARDIAADSQIVAQHDTNFCPSEQPVSPACVTHQMMGFRFQQRNGCNRVPGLEERIEILQRTLETQLTWDPRVVDVYLQRVLMLVDSGAAERVKPRWLQRILAAQLPNGSWSRLQPLLPIGGGRYLGFNDRLAGLGPLTSDFHPTAQGVWLTSLLARGSNEIAGQPGLRQEN